MLPFNSAIITHDRSLPRVCNETVIKSGVGPSAHATLPDGFGSRGKLLEVPQGEEGGDHEDTNGNPSSYDGVFLVIHFWNPMLKLA